MNTLAFRAPCLSRDLRIRLLLVVGAAAFLDTTWFTVLTPLLPHYKEATQLTESQAGILSASYAIGSLIAAVPSGLLAVRVGSRQAALTGLALLAVSSFVFGWTTDVSILMLSRAAQGGSGALMFAGALAWLINVAPKAERGKMMGGAMAAGVFGALAGPPLGALGAAIGSRTLFTAIALIPVLLGLAALTIPDAGHAAEDSRIRTAFGSKTFRTGLLLLIAPSLCFGVLAVLAPLRLDDLGAGAGLIGLAFLLSALTEGVLAPLAGSRSDVIGRRRPFLIGILTSTVAVISLSFVSSVPMVIGGLVVCSAGGGLAIIPALTYISDAAEHLAIPQAFALALSNFGWSAGTAAGGLAAGSLAEAEGFRLPLIVAALLLTITLIRAWPLELVFADSSDSPEIQAAEEE
ncbi:MAG TPA: MFS transporter [Solirubrobacterales bacterium]|nr:MFS transporter [Solirubrobacterales bacterium]